MLAGNDIGPRDEWQMSFVTIMLLAAAIINANIFGNMAVVIASLNKKSTNFQEKLENAAETMKNLKLSDNVQEEVRSYITYTHSTLDHQKELDDFLNMLSPSLRQQVRSQIFYESIMLNPLFSNNKELMTFILNDLGASLFLPEDQIIRQGDDPE
jgi:ABC-type transporter Mla subunit MlaD